MIEKAKNLKLLQEEIEITILNREYLKATIESELPGRDAWLDTGLTMDLQTPTDFVETIQKELDYYISLFGRNSHRNKWITKEELIRLGKEYEKTEYGKYLIILAKEDDKK